MFGLANRHVLLFATEGVFVVRKDNEEKILLGYPVYTSVKGSEALDFGLFEVVAEMKTNVTNAITYESDVMKSEDLTVYGGSLESLFGAPVFKYRPDGADSHLKMTNYNTSSGTILSEEENTNQKQGATFLVRGNGKEFAVRGESGTAVATRGHNGKVQIVGIISGGSGERVQCLFLPFILKEFIESYGIRLDILTSTFQELSNFEPWKNDSCGSMSTTLVPSGSTIFIWFTKDLTKTPEKISPSSINLKDRTIIYLGQVFGKENDQNVFSEILKQERELTRLINQRGTLEDYSIFENDKPDYVAMENSLKACDELYQGNLEMAEKRLKIALRAIKPVDCINCRRLAKFVTYLTWFKLEKNTVESLEEMKDLLKEGIEYYDDNKHEERFPTEVGAYLYYDSARYYLKEIENMVSNSVETQTFNHDTALEKRDRALKMGEKSVHIVEQIPKDLLPEEQKEHNKKDVTRLILMKSDFASALLGCGETFHPKTFVVSSEDINKAEKHIADICSEVHNAPTVQYASYLLACCDLQFRKGNFVKALAYAKECNDLDENRNEFMAKCAEKRMMYLSQNTV